MMNAFATSISIALQYGVPLDTLVEKFSYMRFEPEGITQNPEIPFAKSMPDYIMRWLASRFLDTDIAGGARHHDPGGPRAQDGRGLRHVVTSSDTNRPGNGGGGRGAATAHDAAAAARTHAPAPSRPRRAPPPRR